MSNKEILCPACGKKVGGMRLLNEATFRCGKCKKDIDIKIINSLEREKVERLTKWTIGLVWVSFAAWIVSVFLGNSLKAYSDYLNIAFIILPALSIFLIYYIIGWKKRLAANKELKLFVHK